MRFHPEVLEARQLQILDATGPSLTARGFRLGGGTGLALLLGHRMSEDFDWFSTEPMADPMRLAREIQDEGVALRVQQVARGTIHGTVDGVRLSLLEFSYPLLAEPIRWPEHDVAVLSLDDIADIRVKGQRLFASGALGRERVGLEEIDDGSWSVRFGSFMLDRYDERDETFEAL